MEVDQKEVARPTTKPDNSSGVDDCQKRRQESFEYTKSVLLGKRIKCTLSDGRSLSGRFICIDRLKNIILTNVSEERWIDPSDYKYRVGNDSKIASDSGLKKVERYISQAMIPGSRLTKVEIETCLLSERSSGDAKEDTE